MNNHQYLVPGIFLLLIAIPALLGILLHYWQYFLLRRNGFHTKGIVKELIFDDEEVLAPRLLVEYLSENGRTYMIRSTTGAAFYKNLQGKEIDLVYKIGQPQKAFILMEMKKTNIIVVLVNIILFVCGVYLVLISQ